MRGKGKKRKSVLAMESAQTEYGVFLVPDEGSEVQTLLLSEALQTLHVTVEDAVLVGGEAAGLGDDVDVDGGLLLLLSLLVGVENDVHEVGMTRGSEGQAVHTCTGQ